MSDEQTLVASGGFGALTASSDAALAREWLGAEAVDACLIELTTRPAGATLADLLEERGLVNPVQAAQLGLAPPVRCIGGFEVLRNLGAGAMGEVVLARRPGDGLQVAIKTVTQRHAQDGDFTQRFEREADLIASLHHPHIAGCVARGRHQGMPWLALEFVHGPTVQDLLREHGPFAETDALVIVLHVAKALEHAWDTAQLVHRDIKPGNILIDRSARATADTGTFHRADVAKVIDFGLAKSTAPMEDHQTMTMPGMVMGTPSYMAPEQIHGARDLDHRADQYAVGATLYHLLTGQTPYQGSSSAAVISAHLQSPVPNPGDLVPRLHPVTRDLVMTAMAKDRNQRFGSWQAFLAALQAALTALGRESPTTVKLLRKPLVLPNALRKTPLPGSLTPPPVPAVGSKSGPARAMAGPGHATPPPQRIPVPTRRTPLPTPEQSGEKALAQVMTDRVRQLRQAPDPAPPGTAPLIRRPVVTASPEVPRQERPAAGSSRLASVVVDRRLTVHLVVAGLLAIALLGFILLGP